MADFDDIFEKLVGEEKMTVKELECWYKKQFSKYGMIVLAYKQGKKNKILQYLGGLGSLILKLQQKSRQVEDNDCKQDLLIMEDKAYNLLKIAVVHFDVDVAEIEYMAVEQGDEIIKILHNIIGEGKNRY